MANFHLIGIGGAGLSAIATVLYQQGHNVSGSDEQPSANTHRLAEMGAKIFIGQSPENLPKEVDTVIVSSAISADNPELVAAQQLGLQMMKRPAWLGQMMTGQRGITIAGTHGKTTTTAITAYLLQQAQLDPTFIIGGFVPQMETNAQAGQNNLFVIEADEYDYTFLSLKPEFAILTTMEWDHPDIFPTSEATFEAFVEFAQLVPPHGLLIGCGDDPGVKQVLSAISIPQISYGFDKANDWVAHNLQPNSHGGYDFIVSHKRYEIINVSLQLPGKHNVLNALAAFIVSYQLKVEPTDIAHSLNQFQGVGRRFEQKGKINKITVIDDYAHHPTEIRATLSAARTRYPNQRIWAILQPHTFSRTRTLLTEFSQAFDHADEVIVVDIYPSREVDNGSINSQDIVIRMTHPSARYIASFAETVTYLLDQLSAGDVVITMGAGDGYLIGEQLLAELNRKSHGNKRSHSN